MNILDDRQTLLRKLSGAQFVAWEMHIYLDTHPTDKKALESYKKYKQLANSLKKEFEEKYGLITASDIYGNNRWEWINDPWPWENNKEMMF